MNSKPYISLLYDFYGELLKGPQQQVVELYVNEDLSLSEVAEIMDISRQGVRDSLHRAQLKLHEYEEKLELLKAYQERKERDEQIRELIENMKHTTDDDAVIASLNEIESLMRGDD